MTGSNRPNVVLICADQLRGDTLGIAGHPVVHTPGIDALAHTGHYFPRAVSEVPSCVGARRTLFSGQWPITHGMVGFDDMAPWDEPDTLCRVFQRNGYKTYCIGKRHVYPQDAPCGFDRIVAHEEGRFLSPGYRDDYIDWLAEQGWGDFGLFNAGVTNNGYTARPCVFPEEFHVTTWTATQAIRVMDEHARDHGHDTPFFLFVSFSKPHPPWDPPAFFYERYADDPDLPDPVIGDPSRYVGGRTPFVKAHGPFPEAEYLPLSRKNVRRARAGYYGCIDHVDTQITRFTYHMWRMLQLRNLVFAFVGDHGDMMGDHHYWAKSYGYEGSIRVPFVLNFPAQMDLPAGRRYPETTVGLADLMPTLLDVCGLPAPGRMDGRSLMPLVRGETDRLDRERLHAEHLEFGHYLVNHREKFIWHYRTGQFEYYDLQEDPLECRNLYSDDHPRARGLRDQLRDRIVEQGREKDFMRDGKLNNEVAQSHTHELPPYAV